VNKFYRATDGALGTAWTFTQPDWLG